MSFLSGLLTAVAIVATVISGGALGVLAGALLAGQFASAHGWIGGSVGKFFNSSLGKGITMAVAAAATLGAAGVFDAAAGGGAAATEVGAETAGAATGVAPVTAASVAPGADLMAANEAAGAVSDSAAVSTPGGLLAEATNDGGQAIVASGQATAGDSTLVQGGAQGINAANPSTAAGAQNPAAASQGATATDAAAVQPTTQGAGINNPGAVGGNITAPQAPSIPEAPAAAAGTPPPQGLLSKGMDLINKNPGVAVVAGNALSGMASGISQQKQMEQMLAAQQWANTQWHDPTQVAAMESAAAKPITVPQGYLARAQAVRNLLNGNTQQNGPVVGPQPATAAASAVPNVPGPVPATALNASVPTPASIAAAPRGG